MGEELEGTVGSEVSTRPSSLDWPSSCLPCLPAAEGASRCSAPSPCAKLAGSPLVISCPSSLENKLPRSAPSPSNAPSPTPAPAAPLWASCLARCPAFLAARRADGSGSTTYFSLHSLKERNSGGGDGSSSTGGRSAGGGSGSRVAAGVSTASERAGEGVRTGAVVFWGCSAAVVELAIGAAADSIDEDAGTVDSAVDPSLLIGRGVASAPVLRC